MLALRTNKVGHPVFMQVDEETLSATFCGWLPAHLFRSADAEGEFTFRVSGVNATFMRGD